MFRSPVADVDIASTSVFEFLFDQLADEDAERTALIDPTTGDPTSYRQLRQQIEAFAGALTFRGVDDGTVVGLLSPNTPGFATVFHGILRANATVTTINALSTVADIEKQLLDAKATWLITVSPLLPQAKAAADAVGIPDDRLIVMDGASGHPSLRDLVSERRTPPPIAVDAATHLAVLPYSSGTTGLPKGVMLTHRNLVANVQQTVGLIDLNAEDRVLAVLPFFHIYGMTVLLNVALKQRAALVTMPKFDLAEFLSLTQRHACTFIFIAPPIAVALAKHPLVDDYDISSVRTILSGAAPLDGATGEAAARRIGARMLQGYGMSEMSPVSHLIPSDRPEIPVDSIGVLAPNMDCKLVDPATEREISEFGSDGLTAPGELWLRGPNIMTGYLNNPNATAEVLDADGFLHTGDIAVHHRDGWYRIVDRLKELIKYKGYQIPPAELEALLLSHPQVMDAAVIGVRDADGEEVPKAFVVRAAESALTAEQVMDFVAERVAPYKKVRHVEFIDAVPTSAAGKILRKDLRAAGSEH